MRKRLAQTISSMEGTEILQQTVLEAGAVFEIAVFIPPPAPQIALGLAPLAVLLPTAPKIFLNI